MHICIRMNTCVQIRDAWKNMQCIRVCIHTRTHAHAHAHELKPFLCRVPAYMCYVCVYTCIHVDTVLQLVGTVHTYDYQSMVRRHCTYA